MSRYPDFSFERERLAKYPDAMIIGIDEAGRGPWAGPVVAGAAWISPDVVADLPKGLTDSKKLTAPRRQNMYDDLLELAKNSTYLRLATAATDATDIDDMGILPATFQAMQKASDKLLCDTLPPASPAADIDHVMLLVDGSIRPDLSSPATTTQVEAIIKGDLKVLSIAAASIMAKVTRDHMMVDLANVHPEYSWEKNKGYGTAEHQSALANHGATPYHRMSFRPLAQYR
ncbi:ribonuclease HII [Alphaproteobacteria bacterium]|jgi:ribonuclease HII|nr:ribonuclease HII [Alphaproteobacteria bacterium]